MPKKVEMQSPPLNIAVALTTVYAMLKFKYPYKMPKPKIIKPYIPVHISLTYLFSLHNPVPE